MKLKQPLIYSVSQDASIQYNLGNMLYVLLILFLLMLVLSFNVIVFTFYVLIFL